MNPPFDKFIAATTRWVPENALALAYASQLAYQDKTGVATQLQQWGFDVAHRYLFLDHGDTQGFVAGTDDLVLVSFRGTEPENWRDWATDLDAKLQALTNAPGQLSAADLPATPAVSSTSTSATVPQ